MGKFYIVGIGPLGGGWGAKATEDGVSATVCINDGDTHNSPSEQLEAKFPVLVERYELREDSGGAGRNQRRPRLRDGGAGPGAVPAHHPHRPRALQALGAGGRRRGRRQRHRPAPGRQVETEFPNAKVFNVRLKAGDAYMMRSGGGGGFGRATERDPQLVACDVREGYVSRKVALDTYRSGHRRRRDGGRGGDPGYPRPQRHRFRGIGGGCGRHRSAVRHDAGLREGNRPRNGTASRQTSRHRSSASPPCGGP